MESFTQNHHIGQYTCALLLKSYVLFFWRGNCLSKCYQSMTPIYFLSSYFCIMYFLCGIFFMYLQSIITKSNFIWFWGQASRGWYECHNIGKWSKCLMTSLLFSMSISFLCQGSTASWWEKMYAWRIQHR